MALSLNKAIFLTFWFSLDYHTWHQIGKLGIDSIWIERTTESLQEDIYISFVSDTCDVQSFQNDVVVRKNRYLLLFASKLVCAAKKEGKDTASALKWESDYVGAGGVGVEEQLCLVGWEWGRMGVFKCVRMEQEVIKST